VLAAPPREDWLARSIRGRIARLPNLSTGQGRDRVAFNFGAWLRRYLNLSREQALPWLILWDGGNSPPLGEETLAEISDNALRYCKDAIGCGLVERPPDVPARSPVRIPPPRRYRTVTPIGEA
jgi:hypothetical protein